MSVVLDRYQLVTPTALADVLAELEAHPQAKPFAGGTDLMVLLDGPGTCRRGATSAWRRAAI